MVTLELSPGVPLECVRIPAGPFLMGSAKAKDNQAYDRELQQHNVTLPDFYIGRTNARIRPPATTSYACYGAGSVAVHGGAVCGARRAVDSIHRLCKGSPLRGPPAARAEYATRGARLCLHRRWFQPTAHGAVQGVRWMESTACAREAHSVGRPLRGLSTQRAERVCVCTDGGFNHRPRRARCAHRHAPRARRRCQHLSASSRAFCVMLAV